MVIRIDVMHPFCVKCHINIRLDVKQNAKKISLHFCYFLYPSWLKMDSIAIKLMTNFFDHHEIKDKKFGRDKIGGWKFLVTNPMVINSI